MSSQILSFAAIVLFSLIVPIGIFVGRNNVRVIRREIVEGLVKLFDFAVDEQNKPILIPSFEFVKYKYSPDTSKNYKEKPHSIASYIIPVFAYIVISSLLFYSAFVLKEYQSNSFNTLFSNPFPDEKLDEAKNIHQLRIILTYTFLAGYI
jgi:hypothetical protein